MNPEERYQLEKLSRNTAIVFGTTWESPIYFLTDIEKELNHADFSGKIIFDLLLSNGLSPNRFIAAEVKDKKIDRKSLKVINFSDLGKDLVERVSAFYRQRPDLIKNNFILLDEEKKRILY